MSLSGESPIQEAKADTLRNFVKSGPISANTVCAMPVRIPGILVKSTPKTRCSSERKTPAAEGLLTGGFVLSSSKRGIGSARLELLQVPPNLAITVIHHIQVAPEGRQRPSEREQVFGPVVAAQ
jgi:hypothetical protein